jgi:hypothetical protein
MSDQTPRNELLCPFEKSEKKKRGKSKKKEIFFSTMHFVKVDQLRYPDMTTALQTCYNINAGWHTFFLEAIAFLFLSLRVISFKGCTFITMGGCHHVLTIVKFQSILIR